MRLGEALARCPALVAGGAPTRCARTAVWERSLRRARGDRGRGRGARARARRSSPRRRCGAAHRSRRRRGGAGAGAAARWGAPGEARRRAEPALRPRGGDADAGPPTGDRGRRGAPRARLLAGMPVARCAGGWRPRRRAATAPVADGRRRRCIDSLERLGVRTLGELAALPADGGRRPLRRASGCARCGLARGGDEPLRPRRRPERIECRLELPEAASGQQLEQRARPADRAPARPPGARRRGRSAGCGSRRGSPAGGGWRAEVALRSASSSAERLRLALPRGSRSCPGRRPGSGCARSSSARRRASSARWRARPPTSAAGGSPRRCARRAPRPAATRCCASSRSTLAPASRSAGRCSRPSWPSDGGSDEVAVDVWTCLLQDLTWPQRAEVAA